MAYMCLFQFWFPQGICLGVGLLGHMVVLFLVFLRNLHTIFSSQKCQKRGTEVGHIFTWDTCTEYALHAPTHPPSMLLCTAPVRRCSEGPFPSGFQLGLTNGRCLEKALAPHSSTLLPGKSHGRGSLSQKVSILYTDAYIWNLERWY